MPSPAARAHSIALLSHAANAAAITALFLSAALALALIATAAHAQIPTRNMQVMSHWNEYPPAPNASFGAGYSACWSYIHPDGREYAVIGTTDGTAIYNVTDPINSYRVAFIPGPSSVWREMKSYLTWIYVVTEANSMPPTGIQIIRMTDPEHPVLAATYTTNFQTSHTVSIDSTRALLYCNGTRQWSGYSGYASGMRILSIANPEAPVELGWWPGGAIPSSVPSYVHDCVPIGNRLYAASIYAGTERVLDVTNPATPTEISEWTYPGAYYTHNSWPDATQSYIYVTDEQNGQTLRVFDISNLAAPQLRNQYTANQQAIVHNAVVKGNDLYLAHYTEGVRVLDISDPAHPSEFAWADTYGGTSGGYSGVWGVCPMFPSGTVIGSDMQSGLWVFRPVHDYGLVRVRVVDGSSQPLAGVTVTVPTEGDSLSTPADGIVQFAPSPGAHTISIRDFGYEPVSADVNVSVGSRDSMTLTLVSKPTVSFSGTVTDAVTTGGLSDAEITLAYTPVHQVTDAYGGFNISGVPNDDYRIEVRRAGWAPAIYERQIGPAVNDVQDFALQPAHSWDDLESATAWTVGGAGTGDNATAGAWVRGVPMGTGAMALGEACPCGCGDYEPATMRSGPTKESHAHAQGMSCCMHAESSAPRTCSLGSCAMGQGDKGCLGAPAMRPEGQACSPAMTTAASRRGAAPESGEGRTGAAPPGSVQPASDHSPSGTQCFFTGQGASPSNPDDGDVDGGKTSLTSPVLDITGLYDPVIGYWRWFYTNGDDQDWLTVSISNDNGTTWVPVDTTRGRHNAWEERAIRIADYETPTAQMKVRFAAADMGPASIVEAAVDDITTYDASAAIVRVDPSGPFTRLAFRAPWPNPAHGAVRLALELPRTGAARVEVLDLVGRRVRTLYRGNATAGRLDLDWDGRDEAGHAAPVGLYYASAVAGGQRTSVRFVRAQ
jgi:choice-of-anchor B domain-containing protein